MKINDLFHFLANFFYSFRGILCSRLYGSHPIIWSFVHHTLCKFLIIFICQKMVVCNKYMKTKTTQIKLYITVTFWQIK